MTENHGREPVEWAIMSEIHGLERFLNALLIVLLHRSKNVPKGRDLSIETTVIFTELQ
jgi:hypothetical protein